MAFVRVTEDRTWRVEPGLVKCPDVVQTVVLGTPHLSFDFTDVMDKDEEIIVDAVTESTSTITFTDIDVSPDKKSFSFRPSVAIASAGEYQINGSIQITPGTNHTLAARGILRVI